MEEAYYQALLKCSKRYFYMIDGYIGDIMYWGWDKGNATLSQAEELRDFIILFGQSIDDKLPLLKLNRWLGYIQGSLIQWGITTVEAERDWTRPLFRPLDFKD